MRIHPFAAAALVALGASFAIAHSQEPGSLPEQSRPSGASVPGPARAGAVPLNRVDANSPAQAGRNALTRISTGLPRRTRRREKRRLRRSPRAQAEMRQQEARTKIQELLGGGFTRTPLNAKVLGSTPMDGFRIEKVLYESQPKFYVTALLYVPTAVTNAAGAKFPAIVMAPGHAASGKAGDYAMAATFARNGFVVLSYDPIGQGERLQYPDPANAAKMQAGDPYPGTSLATRPTGEHGEAGLQPTLIGDAVARYFLWDGMRAVDYLISRPEVDADRIGAFGCSGGGAMTALLGAMDTRVKATATACYLTTFDALLPAIGAQDAEQSIPGFIASGFDFADWVELAAPRAYAMVGTVSDMFPLKGFLQTATESRKFYSLFDASAKGTAPNSGAPHLASEMWVPATPTGPTLNPDTANTIPASSPFQVIAGIGGHGNLRPLTSQIVGFFLVHLAGRSVDAYVAPEPTSQNRDVGRPLPDGALQVTPTGQVSTSYPGCATVHTLNLLRAKEKIPQFVKPQTLPQVQRDVREVTRAEAAPGGAAPEYRGELYPAAVQPDSSPITTATGGVETTTYPAPALQADSVWKGAELTTEAGITLHANLYVPPTPGKHPVVVMLRENVLAPGEAQRNAEVERLKAMAAAGTLVSEITPRPSPPGGEETKSPILGPFYLTELRAELVGRPLLGMRVDDVIRAVDYLASRPDVDPSNITVVASGHMGLVALHAAVLDERIKHVTVDHALESYKSLLDAPMPLDAPQDILPGVLLKYDIPDLVRVLGPRLTATDWLPGTANLAAK